MTYPLHQRTFHEFLYYLHNVRVHCCVGRAVKHYRWQLIKSIINGIYVMNQRERIHLASSEVVWHFCGPSPLPPPRCLFLSLTLCQLVSLQNHTGIFKRHMLRFFFFFFQPTSLHTLHPSTLQPRELFKYYMTENIQNMTKRAWCFASRDKLLSFGRWKFRPHLLLGALNHMKRASNVFYTKYIIN